MLCKFLDYTKYRSPLSIFFETDTDLRTSSGDGRFQFWLQNQSDPCKHGLHHKKQIRPGEVVTHQIKWTKKGQCEIVYYTEAQRLCNGQIREDLLGCEASSSGGDSGEWPVARVKIARPPGVAPKQIYVASWTNP